MQNAYQILGVTENTDTLLIDKKYQFLLKSLESSINKTRQNSNFSEIEKKKKIDILLETYNKYKLAYNNIKQGKGNEIINIYYKPVERKDLDEKKPLPINVDGVVNNVTFRPREISPNHLPIVIVFEYKGSKYSINTIGELRYSETSTNVRNYVNKYRIKIDNTIIEGYIDNLNLSELERNRQLQELLAERLISERDSETISVPSEYIGVIVPPCDNKKKYSMESNLITACAIMTYQQEQTKNNEEIR